jgi:hypothetical protein
MCLSPHKKLRWGLSQADERGPGALSLPKIIAKRAARKQPGLNQSEPNTECCLKYLRNDANSMLIKKLPVKSQPFICPIPGSCFELCINNYLTEIGKLVKNSLSRTFGVAKSDLSFYKYTVGAQRICCRCLNGKLWPQHGCTLNPFEDERLTQTTGWSEKWDQ